jgi:hypothetical protein
MRSARRITCASADRSATAALVAGKAGTWKYSVTLRRLTMASPAMPSVTLRIRHGAGAIDRIGHLGSCTPPAATLRCAMP